MSLGPLEERIWSFSCIKPCQHKNKEPFSIKEGAVPALGEGAFPAQGKGAATIVSPQREPPQQLSSLTTRAEELSSYCVRQPIAWQSSRSTMGNLALHSAEEPDNLRKTTGTVEVPTER